MLDDQYVAERPGHVPWASFIFFLNEVSEVFLFNLE